MRAACVLLLAWLTLGAGVARADDPRLLIVDTTNRFLAALKEQRAAIKADPQIAYRLVERTVLPYLDFPRIAHWVLGRYWRSATPAQRQRFTEELRTFLTRTYVTAMITYADKILAQADNVSYPPVHYGLEDRDVMVPMVIELPERGSIQVGYRMYRSGTHWRIYDVVIEGVSLAITYRTSFATEIQQVGLQGLIDAMAKRNRDAGPLPAPPAAAP